MFIRLEFVVVNTYILYEQLILYCTAYDNDSSPIPKNAALVRATDGVHVEQLRLNRINFHLKKPHKQNQTEGTNYSWLVLLTLVLA